MIKTNGDIFFEQQRLPFIYKIISALIFACAAIAFIFAITRSDNFYGKKSLVITAGISFAISLTLTTCIFCARLTTRIDAQAVYVRFFPFMIREKKLLRKNILRSYLREYRPFVEYCGWGIRWNSNGKAYIAGGNWGMQLEFKSGDKILLGTKKKDEFEKAINS